MAEVPLPPARLVSHRRPRYGRWLVVLALLVLIGRGMGWAGHEVQPTGGAKQPGRLQADLAASAAAAASPAGAPLPEAMAEHLPPPAAPAGEMALPPAAPAPATAVVADAAPPAFDADRFAALQAAVGEHTERGELGAALATVHHLRALPLDGAQRTALLAVTEPLEQALAAACARIVEGLCQGRVLQTREQLAQLFADGEPFAEPWLDSALRAVGVGHRLLGRIAPRQETLPVARPLARGRDVRVRTVSRQGVGTVVDSRAGQVTLRVATTNGWSFPTLAALAVEPVEPTADEATEMALLAVQADDAVLARLWFAVACVRSPKGLGERAQLLAPRLR